MSFLDVMHEYFRGEKLEAIYFILPAGLALVGFGIVAFKAERGGFAWGAAVPAIVFGLLLIATGLGIGLRTKSQVAALEEAHAESPVAMVQAELPRMEKVNKNFRATYFVFGALAALGLILHYAGMGWSRSLGAVLVLGGGLGLLIDGFAERRAEPYTAALEQLAQSAPEPTPET